jgi:hypothetical protein
MSSILTGLLGSAIRGGIIKEGVKQVAKGIKGVGKQIVKGVKRGATKVVRGVKSGVAQVKSLPKGIERARVMYKINPEGWAKLPTGDKITRMVERVNQVRLDAGQKALTKDSAERMLKAIQKLGTATRAKKSLQTIMKNVRAGETYKEAGMRLLGDAGKWFRGVAKAGGENMAIDQTTQILGKGAMGLGGGVVAGATTAAIIDKKK